VTHYFYARVGYGFDKKHTGTHYTKLVFLRRTGSVGHVVNSRMSVARISNTLFFMLRWDRYGSDKKHAFSPYAELVFLHPVGSVGHVVHSGASMTQNGDALFFMLS
jgi:hypothetical protein